MQADPLQPGTQSAAKGSNRADVRRWRMRERAFAEGKRFVLIFLYLWLLFGLFALHEMIILRERGAGYTFQGFAIFNALVLAKVMLALEHLDLARWLRRRPLIYPVLFESLLFTVAFICVHFAEKVIIGLVKGETIAASVPSIGGGGLAGLLCVAAILFTALIPYFAFRNISRKLGAGRLSAMLFSTAPQS